MGVLRLRVLAALACMLALLTFTAFGYTTAELRGIAASELIPEISAAAGAALAQDYVLTMTEAQLLDLAANGATIGLRTAGSNALSEIYLQPVLDIFSKTGAVIDKAAVTALEQKLTGIANGTSPEMVRASAIEPLYELFVGEAGIGMTKAATLLGLAGDMTKTHEFRLAAARAYYFLSKASTKVVSFAVLENSSATYASDELAYAAGELLGGLYAGFFPKTQAQYEDLAKNGANLTLRVAGKVGLTPLLLGKSAAELEVKLLDLVNITTPEYRGAYQDALAYQFSL